MWGEASLTAPRPLKRVDDAGDRADRKLPPREDGGDICARFEPLNLGRTGDDDYVEPCVDRTQAAGYLPGVEMLDLQINHRHVGLELRREGKRGNHAARFADDAQIGPAAQQGANSVEEAWTATYQQDPA
jgi:hypothetical protein